MKVRCTVCDSDDQWENVDEYRHVKKGMSICNKCGFVSYPERVANQSKIKDYYEEDYRPPPNVGNIYTCERKLQYHSAFLDDVFNEMKVKKPKANVLEIGSAFGMVLDWVKSYSPDWNVYGTELTKSFVRNAYWLYGLELQDDYDDSLKYDMVMSYKVHEHIPNSDEHLKKLHSCLNDDGLLYISVPCWFDKMSNFGLGGFDIEYYYHPDHINVWTKKLFESVLKKTGFEIVRYNGSFYDDTYLCKKVDPQELTAEDFENPNEVKVWLSKIYKAAKLFEQGKAKESIEVWGNFPTAYNTYYELNRKEFHERGVDDTLKQFIEPAIANTKGDPNLFVLAADVLMRYDKLELALKFIDEGANRRPGSVQLIIMKSQCFRRMAELEKDPAKKRAHAIKARDLMLYLKEISSQSFGEAMSWSMADNAGLEIPEKELNAEAEQSEVVDTRTID